MKEPGGDRRDVFNGQERAVLRFTRLLASHSSNVQQSDLDEMGQQFSAEQIIELVFTIATASLTNRINDGLLTPIDV